MDALYVKLDGHKRRSSPSDGQKRGAALARISGETNGGKCHRSTNEEVSQSRTEMKRVLPKSSKQKVFREKRQELQPTLGPILPWTEGDVHQVMRKWKCEKAVESDGVTIKT